MIHYIDPEHGGHHADGLTPATAARTVRAHWCRPGVTLLFRRGTVTRGSLPIFSGTADDWARIGAYGEGHRPVFTLAADLASPLHWTPEQPGVWRCTTPVDETANIIYNDEAFCGAKRWTRRDLDHPGDWHEDGSTLLVRSDENPGLAFSAIEHVPARTHVHFKPEHAYIRVEDIHIKNAGVHGFWITGGHHIVLSRCEVSYIGGTVYPAHGIGVPEGLTVRYGNAIEIWSAGHHVMVEGCRVYETYDGAVCLQGLSNDLIHDVSVRGCTFFNNAFDTFDWSWGVRLRNIYFENNTCVSAGVGWGIRTEGRPRLSAFLPDAVGWHFFITNVNDPAEIKVRNNIFYDCPLNPLMKFRCEPPLMKDIVLDHNCYFQPDPRGPIVWFNGKLYHQSNFKQYRSISGKDMHSIFADPLFSNPAQGDYTLRDNSPCRGAGCDTSASPLLDGMPESLYTGTDIGAVETQPDQADAGMASMSFSKRPG